MPYVRCVHCGLKSFTAACWSSVDRCGRCDEPLVSPRRRASVGGRPPLIVGAGDAAGGAEPLRRARARPR
jgi:hypothetical protein